MADLGQIFTRKVVAEYMVSLFDLSKKSNILDPCFGAGAFLEALQCNGFENVTGCEIDANLFKINQNKFKKYNLFQQDFLQFGLPESFDGIIMNPPYIRQEKIDDLQNLGITKKFLRQNIIYKSLPSTANMYMYFILKAMNLLKVHGQLVVIFPSSWLNSRSGKQFKKALLERGRIEKAVYLYGDVFEKEALVDVVILKVIKTTDLINMEEEYLEVQEESIFPKILKKEKNMTFFECPFSKIASIQRGITTGYNKMFINPEIQVPVNSGCLKKIISSPKSIVGYSTCNAKFDQLLDCEVNNVPQQIKKYLDIWKKKILEEEKPKSLFTKIKKDKCWYKIRLVSSRGIIFSYFVRNDMKFILNDSETLVRDNFYIIRPHIDQLVMMALLNNYYIFYQLELFVKRYGAGLLKLQKYDLERLRFPFIEKISDEDIVKLKKLGQGLITSSNSDLVEDITKVLSNYSDVNYETIRKKYIELKKRRLEDIKNEN